MAKLTRLPGNFPADGDCRNFRFVQVRKNVDVHEQPVGHDNQAVDVAFEEHFQVALEAIALVVGVGEDGKVGERVEGVLDAAQNWSAEGIGDVGEHYADALAALAAQEARHGVRTVAEALGGFFNLFLGAGGDVAGERRVVQNDGNGRGGKARGFGDVPHGDQPASALCFHPRLARLSSGDRP